MMELSAHAKQAILRIGMGVVDHAPAMNSAVDDQLIVEAGIFALFGLLYDQNATIESLVRDSFGAAQYAKDNS
jgi:hypothetical protein